MASSGVKNTEMVRILLVKSNKNDVMYKCTLFGIRFFSRVEEAVRANIIGASSIVYIYYSSNFQNSVTAEFLI